MSAWIACSEWMPAKGHPVLVFGKNADRGPSGAVAWWTGDHWSPWGVIAVSGGKFRLDLISTHWQNLPEPPAELKG